VLTAAIGDRSDQIAVQEKVLLHAASPLIPDLTDKKTQWRASLFPRAQSMPQKS
jgi:hypothetical protein